MPSLPYSAHAIVEVKLKIRAAGSWGEDATMAQVRKQAVESALAKLRKATNDSRDYGIVGEPVVTATILSPNG